jgi:hypothetical protein
MPEESDYARALRTIFAERRALWAILQEFVGRYAVTVDDPTEVLGNMSERIMFRLDLKDADANEKGLGIMLATVKDAVDRFFSELSQSIAVGEF